MKVAILDCGAGFEANLLSFFDKHQHFAKIISDSGQISIYFLTFD
jgi:hypothetical protein